MGFCNIKHLVVLVAIVVLGSIDCHSQWLDRIQKALPQQEAVDSGKIGSSVVDSLRRELELARQREAYAHDEVMQLQLYHSADSFKKEEQRHRIDSLRKITPAFRWWLMATRFSISMRTVAAIQRSNGLK